LSKREDLVSDNAAILMVLLELGNQCYLCATML